jgi:hypothetical protein
VPTPVVHTRLRAPASRIGPADDVDGAARASPLFAKYGSRVDEQSAREMLAARMEGGDAAPAEKPAKRPRRREKVAVPTPGGGADAIGDFLRSSTGKKLQRDVLRGVFGMLKKRL